MYKGNDFLAAFRFLDRPPDHCRSHNRRMRVQNRFDFHRVDILSEANDQFLGSANDKKRAVFKTGKVTSVEPPLSINRRGFLLRRMIVPFHDVGTADP